MWLKIEEAARRNPEYKAICEQINQPNCTWPRSTKGLVNDVNIPMIEDDVDEHVHHHRNETGQQCL